jgi:phosphoserine phosphatase
MTHVATLIANPLNPALSPATAERARTVLPDAGDIAWLADGIAADIPFTLPAAADQRALGEEIRRRLDGGPFDVVLQPVQYRRKKLFVGDMDSTMIGQECVDELADHVGLKSHVSAITERAMRGEIAFVPALTERVALLKGLPESLIEDLIRTRITLTPGARTLVATMRANGAYTCLVSGGFTQFTSRIAALIGFDENRGNTLGIADGKLTGEVEPPILGREAKLATLVELTQRLALSAHETLAAGDGANDLDMLAAAGLGIAYHAKPTVAAAAHARIDHGDLTALLYLQGYRREEFVEKA